MAQYPPEPRGYELMVLLSPDLDSEALDGEIERISNQIADVDARIVNVKSTTPWGRRRLAYPIQRHQDAFYVLYSVISQPGNLDSVERNLKLNGNVLRYLLVREEKTESMEESEEAEETETVAETDTEESAEDEESATGGDEEASAEAEAEESEPASVTDEERA